MGTLVWRVIGTGGAILAGVLANKVVVTLWRKARGEENLDPYDPRAPMKEAIAFAAVTGLAVGAARVIATRKAAQFYEHSSGHLPKQLQKIVDEAES